MVRMSNIFQERFWKGILTFNFLLLSVALIIAWNTPATGYESSIYWSTPLILWVGIISSVITGTGLVILTIAKDELEKHQIWKIGLFLIILVYTICLGLFIIRGYHMWCMAGDPANHIGWVREMLIDGYAPEYLIYPVTHIYLSEVVLITGLDLIILHKVIPLIFGLLCVLFMFSLGKALFTNHGGVVLVTIISCCLTFGWYINLTPNGLSNLCMPFAFYIMIKYFQERQWKWFIPLSIIIIIYPLFHILPAIVFGLVLLTFMIPTKITGAIKKVHGSINNFKFDKGTVHWAYPLLLLVIWFTLWISTFLVFNYTIRNIYETIAFENGDTKVLALLDQISYAQIHGYSFIDQAFKLYGAEGILLILSLPALFILWKNITSEEKNKYLFSFCGPFAAIILLMAAVFMFNLSFGPFRFMVYFSVFGTLFSAYLFYIILNYKSPVNRFFLNSLSLRTLLVTQIITIIFILSLLVLYPSPYNLGTSFQTTKSEISGMSHFYDFRDVSVQVTGITAAPGRLSQALLTPEERSSQRLPLYLNERRVPWHFGYDTNYSIFSSYPDETDLIITQRDKILYEEIFPKMAGIRFTEQDFERLKWDHGLHFLYSNGEFDYMKIDVKNQVLY